MIAVYWTVVLRTSSEPTALRLLHRVLDRFPPGLRSVWLRPWGPDRSQRAALIEQPWENLDTAGLGALLEQAQLLSATWTLEFPWERVPASPDILLQGWTPAEYSKFTLDGISAISFVVRPLEEEPQATAGVRLVQVGDITVFVVR